MTGSFGNETKGTINLLERNGLTQKSKQGYNVVVNSK